MKRLLPLLLLLWLPAAAQESRLLGTVPAVEFPPGLDWINTAEPLTLSGLRGRAVLLDFWTYGCINCVHVIPDLAALQEKYDEELVVIGVHSAKFTNEALTDNIRLIAERYGRREPIVNDHAFEIWSSYGMNAWPGFILIDPEGNVVGRHAGEGIFELFDSILSEMIPLFEARGTLVRAPLDFVPGGEVRPRSALRFPGKLLADPVSGRLYIADSGNNRIVVTDFSGTVLEVIGSGAAELRDGTFSEAAFRAPQGLSLDDEGGLYVADTGNHALRYIDPEAGTVTTVAGNGEQEYMFGLESVDGLVHGLNSPWDVLWVDSQLFVAMAGQHQVWRFDPSSSYLYLHAGSGHERLLDGPLRNAGLNQPSGLASDGRYLYIADSEASAVRRADLDPDGELVTLVGTGLFDFGDVDGTGDEVRLQHPKSVSWADGIIYIADTYNNGIKQLDPESRSVRRILGENEAGFDDGSGLHTSFHEPGGVSLAGGFMFIADTNNNAVRIVNMETADVATLALSDPDSLLLRPALHADSFDEVIFFDPLTVAPGSSQLQLQLSLPAGYTANFLAPLSVELSSAGAAVQFTGPDSFTISRPGYPLELTSDLELSTGGSELQADVAVYYCEEQDTRLCLIRQVRLIQPLEVTEGTAAREVALSWQPPPLP